MTSHWVVPTSLIKPTRREWVKAAIAMGAVSALGLGPHAVQAQELFDLEKVRASGVLKVAVYKDNAPYSDGKGQDMEGVDVALARALAMDMGLKLSLLPFDAGEKMDDDLRNMVWRGHYLGYGPADVMLHVPVDKHLMVENRQALIFAPYSREVLVVFHALDRLPALKSGLDLQDLPLAAERGSGAASTLIGFGGGAFALTGQDVPFRHRCRAGRDQGRSGSGVCQPCPGRNRFAHLWPFTLGIWLDPADAARFGRQRLAHRHGGQVQPPTTGPSAGGRVAKIACRWPLVGDVPRPRSDPRGPLKISLTKQYP